MDDLVHNPMEGRDVYTLTRLFRPFLQGMAGACLIILNSKLYGLETVIKAKWRLCQCCDSADRSLLMQWSGQSFSHSPGVCWRRSKFTLRCHGCNRTISVGYDTGVWSDCFDGVQIKLRHVPKYLCGDMDSIRPEVLQFYEQKVTYM